MLTEIRPWQAVRIKVLTAQPGHMLSVKRRQGQSPVPAVPESVDTAPPVSAQLLQSVTNCPSQCSQCPIAPRIDGGFTMTEFHNRVLSSTASPALLPAHPRPSAPHTRLRYP